MTGSFFVPDHLDAPVRGAATGPLAGLTAVVKDMYDIAGSRTGGGNPEQAASARKTVAAARAAALAAGRPAPCWRRPAADIDAEAR